MPSNPEITTARYNARNFEIQWRGAGRDLIALVVAPSVCGTLATQGMWAFIAPIVLFFVAVFWQHHNQRVGSCARYMRDVLEPKMAEYDAVEGFENYLDRNEPDRSYNNRFSFTSVVTRLYFPTLQAGMVVLGIARYLLNPAYDPFTVNLLLLIAAIDLALIALTFIKVEHRRIPPANHP